MLGLCLALLVMFLSINIGFAQDAVSAVESATPAVEKALVPVVNGVVQLPEWVGSIIEFLKTVPYVGPVVVKVFKVVGIVSAIFTALVIFIQAFLSILIGVAGFVKAQPFADFVSRISGKVMPILKYLSIFNVQKKK